MDAEERTLTANGLRHHVLVWNDGAETTLVCCHGFLDHAWGFREFAETLAATGLRITAFDWRGHGGTEHVGAGGYYHFADYVLDLHELMPLMASGPVHLLGHSMGGTACAMYAATHPGVARTLTLVEGLGPPSFEGEAPDKLRTWLDSMDRHRRRDPKPMADLTDAVMRMRSQHRDVPVDLAYFLAEKGTVETDDGCRWSFDPLHRTSSPAFFTADLFATFLRRIEVPTLIVSGASGYRTADHASRVAELPDAREVTIEGVGHMVHWLKPSALAEVVLAHLGSAR